MRPQQITRTAWNLHRRHSANHYIFAVRVQMPTGQQNGRSDDAIQHNASVIISVFQCLLGGVHATIQVIRRGLLCCIQIDRNELVVNLVSPAVLSCYG